MLFLAIGARPALKNVQSSRILVTTSRNPPQAVSAFCNDLVRSIPNSIKASRSKSSLDNLAEKALEHEAVKIVIVDCWRGNIGKIRLFEVGESGLSQFYPLILVKRVVLRRTFEHVRTKAVRALVLLTAAKVPFEADRLAASLSNFFKISRLSADEELSTEEQAAMHISLDAAHRIQITFLQTLLRVEVGPRTTVSHLVQRPRK